MNLAHSKPQWKRFFSSQKGKGECVFICRHVTHSTFMFYCSYGCLTIVRCSFPICAVVNCFYFILQGSLKKVEFEVFLQHSLTCFLKFHRMIESYGQVRLGMVSLLCFQYHIT